MYLLPIYQYLLLSSFFFHLLLTLGDLVAKGTLSPEVVRLAMDVEGNHDHEVVRQRLLHMDARAVRSANARAAAAAAAAATTTTTTTVSA